VTDQFRKRCQISPIQVETFSNNELPSHFCFSRVLQVLFPLLLKLPLQVSHVIVFEILDFAPRGTQSLLDREAHALIAEDNISPLGVGRDGTGDGSKSIGVENGLLPPSEPS